MQELHTREIVSKENTKWDTSRCYVGKSYNSFSLEVNKQLCAYSKRIFREFLGFFFEACYLEEKDTLSVRMYGTLFGRCGIHSNAHHNIFSICFKFTIPRDHFCDVLSVSFSLSLLLLKMSFNPFQDGLFGAAHGWGVGGGRQKGPPP